LGWKFTKDHLNALLGRVAAHHADHTLAVYPDHEYVTESSCQTTKVTMTGSMPVKQHGGAGDDGHEQEMSSTKRQCAGASRERQRPEQA